MKLNLKEIKALDKSDMLDSLVDFPRQCEYAYTIAQGAKILFEKREFSSIVFAGLGGSAIGADLVKAYLYFDTKIPITVCRDYALPGYVDNSTLVFVSSYSGNTEETLSTYADAKAGGAYIICISSGGKLKEYADKDKITFVEVPKGLAPRCALGYLSLIPLSLLARMGLIKEVNAPIKQMIKVLEDLRNNCLNPAIGRKDNIAKAVALKLVNNFAVIYTASVHFDVCATRWRGQLNENSKALASTHLFPEMNHNEIVGWQNPKKLFKKFTVIMLRDSGMHGRVAKRMDITKDILKKDMIELIEVWSRGEDLLSRIFSLIYIGDFISYYLAILYGIDPTPVDRITYLKNRLAQE